MYLITRKDLSVSLKINKHKQLVGYISMVGSKTTIKVLLMHSTIRKIKKIRDGTEFGLFAYKIECLSLKVCAVRRNDRLSSERTALCMNCLLKCMNLESD